ncbi:MAG: DAK2 domain-containing protein, partial [Rhodobacteraceae bacterium]|nr:DAK2 domain-containing protein [Paracoccaceae bacterium]
PREDRIPAGLAELGLGIHGEPGVDRVDFSTAETAMALVLERLETHSSEGPLIALLNNLGGCTPLEMSVLAHALHRAPLADRIEGILGPAPLMTSLDMKGFSVSLLAPTENDRAALQSPVSLPAWAPLRATGTPVTVALPDGLQPRKPTPSTHPQAHAIMQTCCHALLDAEADLNALDAKSGDGDTGSTLATAARSLQARLDQLPLAVTPELFSAIGQELSETMGGSSGVLMAIFFAAAGEASARGDTIPNSLKAGLDRIMQVGGAHPGDRTLIDALEPALAQLRHGCGPAAAAARHGANATAALTQARAGRASYVSAENLTGHNDPGAEAVARLFEALAAT